MSRLLISDLTKRYKGVTPEALANILNPILLPIKRLDKKVFKISGQSHYRASFEIEINKENETILQIGRTGKFIPSSFLDGGDWKEIAKGRIIEIDYINNMAIGEVYIGNSSVNTLKEQLNILSNNDLLEIDQYGAAAKILSSLSEYYLSLHGKDRGFKVIRMPEDMAKHLGSYANFDFIFEKDGVKKTIEVKSLWGTDTRYARLIHSTTTAPKGPPDLWTESQKKNYYPTSSCKFTTQDIFAVNLFLRTGNVFDFAFAKSISKENDPIHGLSYAKKYPDHVHQNPLCEVDNIVWFSDINDIW